MYCRRNETSVPTFWRRSDEKRHQKFFRRFYCTWSLRTNKRSGQWINVNKTTVIECLPLDVALEQLGLQTIKLKLKHPRTAVNNMKACRSKHVPTLGAAVSGRTLGEVAARGCALGVAVVVREVGRETSRRSTVLAAFACCFFLPCARYVCVQK